MLLDLLNHLDRSLRLDIDDDYYGEKIISDLLFTEEAIHRLFVSLSESTLQLDRDQYFRLLYQTMELFSDIGGRIIADETGRSINVSGFIPRLKESMASQQEYMEEIRNLLNTDIDTEGDADQISQEEMSFLMSDTENNEA